MKERIIDIKAESLPWHIKLIGALFLIGALTAITSYWWLSIILALVGLTLLSGYSGTEIDFTARTFREYDSYLFLRRGMTEKYNEIDKIFINQAKVAQKMYTAHTGSSSTFENVLFNAYLKFDDGKKVFLTSRKDKARLVKLLKPVATVLAVDLTDNTVAG